MSLLERWGFYFLGGAVGIVGYLTGDEILKFDPATLSSAPRLLGFVLLMMGAMLVLAPLSFLFDKIFKKS